MNIGELDTFGKRLSFLLDLKEIQKQDLAKAINLSPTSVSNYLNDSRKPDILLLGKIADFLNVNTDFLVMRNDDYQTYVSKIVNGKLVELTFEDEELHLTEKQIEDFLSKLKSFGFDIKKALDYER